jgi:hypothetical protein
MKPTGFIFSKNPIKQQILFHFTKYARDTTFIKSLVLKKQKYNYFPEFINFVCYYL